MERCGEIIRVKVAKAKGLKKCPHCGSFPMPKTGEEGLTGKIVFSLECDNDKCNKNPSTGNRSTLQEAFNDWNNGIVTQSLFAKNNTQ